MDLFFGQTNFGGGGKVPVWNLGNMLVAASAAVACHFAPFLGSVVFRHLT